MDNQLTCEQPDHGEYASGNIFLRRVRLAKAGDVLPGHTHNFDHTTFVSLGRIHVLVDCPCGKQKEQEFGPGEHFLVKADHRHTITALTDDVQFHCIYAHRNPQGEVVQEFTGWMEAYV